MKKLLAGLSSLRLTLVAMLMLIGVVLYDLEISALHEGWLATCLGLLALNLAFAIAVRPQFRRQPGLLVFHVCLLAVAGLAATQVMTSFEGRIELAENQAFSIESTEVLKRGPWHVNRLGKIKFVQGPVRVDYRPNLRRGRTSTEVIYFDGDEKKSTVFGDTRSFKTKAYRFVTTANKGFVLALSWLDEDGQAVSGNIHMPSFPLWEWKQRNQWLAPTGEMLEFELQAPPVPVDKNWTLSSRDFKGRVFMHRHDDRRVELELGHTVKVDGGGLRLDEIGLWIGYRIESNLILPWLFASATLGTIALAWHFWQNPPVFRAAG